MCVLSPPSSEDQVSNHKLTQATEWDMKSYPGKVVGRVRFLSWLASGVPLMDSCPETLISTTDHFIKALEAFRDGAQLVAAAHSRSGSLKDIWAFISGLLCLLLNLPQEDTVPPHAPPTEQFFTPAGLDRSLFRGESVSPAIKYVWHRCSLLPLRN